jgi:hypothetical protein
MKFNLEVDINVDEVADQIASKAKVSASKIIDEEIKRKVNLILDGHNRFTDKLYTLVEQAAEDRVRQYIQKFVDEVFEVSRYSSLPGSWYSEKFKEVLGIHLQNKVEEFVSEVKFPENYDTRVIDRAAYLLVKDSRFNKKFVEKLAKAIADNQNTERSK